MLETKEKENQKKCSKCKKKFPATPEYFYKSKAAKSGLHYYCKTCLNEHSKARYKKVITAPSGKPHYEQWDANKHEPLYSWMQEAYEKDGTVPPGFKPCKKCNRVLPNLKARFPWQPRRNGVDKDGKRKLMTTCRTCQKGARRREQAFKEKEQVLGWDAEEYWNSRDLRSDTQRYIEDGIGGPPLEAGVEQWDPEHSGTICPVY